MRYLSLVVIFLFFTSCQNRQEKATVTEFKGVAMTVPYQIVVGESLNEIDQERVRLIVKTTFEEINKIYNKWNPDSELSKLNRLKSGVKFHPSKELLTLLKLTDELVKVTEGRFDPTIEPLQKVWRKALESGKLPDSNEVNIAVGFVGWNLIHIEGEWVWKDFSQVELDLGGIAKGYGVDLILQRLKDAGFKNLLVDWGGDLAASGKHPSGRSWNVFITRFGDKRTEQALAFVELEEQALATSGDYEQYWSVRGGDGAIETYTHVIDPSLKEPLKAFNRSISSFSVRADCCALADAIATAGLLLQSSEEVGLFSEKLERSHPGIKIWAAGK